MSLVIHHVSLHYVTCYSVCITRYKHSLVSRPNRPPVKFPKTYILHKKIGILRITIRCVCHTVKTLCAITQKAADARITFEHTEIGVCVARSAIGPAIIIHRALLTCTLIRTAFLGGSSSRTGCGGAARWGCSTRFFKARQTSFAFSVDDTFFANGLGWSTLQFVHIIRVRFTAIGDALSGVLACLTSVLLLLAIEVFQFTKLIIFTNIGCICTTELIVEKVKQAKVMRGMQ